MLEGLGARLFAETAKPAQVKALEVALTRVERAYATDEPQVILTAKNDFYDAIHSGSGSENLSKMTATVLAQIWRWRAIGLTHPKRSKDRSRESARNLRDVVDAIRSGDGERAEQAARHEARLAASEVLRLLDCTESPASELPD
jgi:DNA-binding GntR family transcriptional regulator